MSKTYKHIMRSMNVYQSNEGQVHLGIRKSITKKNAKALSMTALIDLTSRWGKTSFKIMAKSRTLKEIKKLAIAIHKLSG